MNPTTTSTELNMSVEKMEKVAFILKTTAHPTRIAIVQLLAQQESLSVTEISEKLHVEQSLLSHHLTGMKLKGILSSTREGKSIFYSLKMREVVDVIQCLASCTFL
ncbi:ArsR/SmtB family transcription factor [Hymenobacter lapidiphilus]|nr:metalloregulator ArsR/SmtB family transcription factor [Hymenobacter lapidiphilus]